MNENKKNEFISNLLVNSPELAENIDKIISTLKASCISDEIIYKILNALDKNNPTHIQVVNKLIFGICLQDSSYIENLINLLKDNPYAINENIFEDFSIPCYIESATFNNNDIIFALGDFFELAYAKGHYYVSDLIRAVYKKLKPTYSSPIIIKIKFDFCSVYSWHNDEALSIYNRLNYYENYELYKCTPFEKALIYFYKGILLTDLKKRNLNLLDISTNSNSINSYFRDAKQLGYPLAKNFIIDEPYYPSNNTYYDNFDDYVDINDL